MKTSTEQNGENVQQTEKVQKEEKTDTEERITVKTAIRQNRLCMRQQEWERWQQHLQRGRKNTVN